MSLVLGCHTRDFAVIASDGRGLSPLDHKTPVLENCCKFLPLPALNCIVAATGTSDFCEKVFRESAARPDFAALSALLHDLIVRRKESGGRPCAALLIGEAEGEMRANSWSTLDDEHTDLPSLSDDLVVGIPSIGYEEIAQEGSHRLASQLAPLVRAGGLTANAIIQAMQEVYDGLATECQKINTSTFFYVLRVRDITRPAPTTDGGQRAFQNIRSTGHYDPQKYHLSAWRAKTTTTKSGDTTAATWTTVASFTITKPEGATQYKGLLRVQRVSGTEETWIIDGRILIGSNPSNVIEIQNPTIDSGYQAVTITGLSSAEADVLIEVQCKCTPGVTNTGRSSFSQITYTDQDGTHA